jgi:cellulose synthase/poly-beta-1,6-N-acetylglucosamine synthase-like glycosyltransferase
MFPLICAALVILGVLGLKRLLPGSRKHRRQVRFIRETLASSKKSGDRRVIVSLSTVPERMDNLGPTIRSLLRQTRPPDEIVLAIPEFSIREQRPYAVPKHISRWPRMRILHCRRDWGPATKFIPIVRDELAAGRGDTLIMVVDDDRVYPRDALETYLHYNKQLPDAALCFRGAAMPRSLDWRDARMIRARELRQPQPAAVITGCGSYLIQPRFFDESLWDYFQAPQGAFYMDDIWISGCLARRNVKRYVVPASAMMRSVFRQRRTLSLHDVPDGRQYNNNETIAFFGDAWDVFASH